MGNIKRLTIMLPAKNIFWKKSVNASDAADAVAAKNTAPAALPRQRAKWRCSSVTSPTNTLAPLKLCTTLLPNSEDFIKTAVMTKLYKNPPSVRYNGFVSRKTAQIIASTSNVLHLKKYARKITNAKTMTNARIAGAPPPVVIT